MAKPILPRNEADPQGTDRSERRAMADFQRRMRQVLKLYRDALNATPYTVVTVNATRYDFDLNPAILASLTAEINASVDRVLLEGGEDRLWFMLQYVAPSYQAGTAAQWRNLGSQSEPYRLGRPELASILQSQPYRDRIAYLAARQFEEMKGFTEETKTVMGRILTDGFVQGLNPREIGKQLTEIAGKRARRGETIARTEIGNALRQARLDEAQQAGTDYGLHTRELHFSALSPTTRASHRARHGTVHTAQAQRVWWATDANSINCKCGSITILTTAAGIPLDPDFVARVAGMKR